MADIALGILAILAGALFCFGGAALLRLAFPVWGAFAGFGFGAGIVAGLSDERVLGTLLGWVLGLVFALIFAMCAYFFFALGVFIAMVAVGFTLGSGLVVALGIEWNWLAVIVGAALGALVGLASVLADAPTLLLTVLASIAGAIAVVSGLMLVTGAMESADFTARSFTDRVDDDWWWYALFALVAVAGILVQSRNAAALRRSIRDGWAPALS